MFVITPNRKWKSRIFQGKVCCRIIGCSDFLISFVFPRPLERYLIFTLRKCLFFLLAKHVHFQHSAFCLQGYEDWLRHKADKEVNHRATKIVQHGGIREAKAMEIRVCYVTEQSFAVELFLLSATAASELSTEQSSLTHVNDKHFSLGWRHYQSWCQWRYSLRYGDAGLWGPRRILSHHHSQSGWRNQSQSEWQTPGMKQRVMDHDSCQNGRLKFNKNKNSSIADMTLMHGTRCPGDCLFVVCLCRISLPSPTRDICRRQNLSNPCMLP